jgi:mannose-1-phosphate guanylyltransferase/mannose-6-phosphate isomerase
MTIVIIAGGQGTRLWPLSRAEQPKHLLSLVNDDSLLQNTISRVESLTDSIFIVPEASHVDDVKKQLPKYKNNIIVEPTRKGTAHCILFALAELKNKISNDEVIVFLHADHHIGDIDSFKETVEATVKASKELNKITLIGVAPDYPATGFGYIKTGKEVANEDGLPIMSVEKFVEKPDEKTARSYFKSKKYLWNLGLFAGSINTFEAEIKKSNKSLWKRYNQLFEKDALESYMNFPNEPIDTALIEKVKDLIVVPGHFDWADIGSFKDLYEILRNGDSNVHKGDVYDIDSKESLVIADKKPIITIGLDNLIVVDTPEGILVCPKDKCQLVKDGVEKLNSKK